VVIVITNVGLWFTNVDCELQYSALYMQRFYEFSDWISKNIFWSRYIDISMSNPASVPVMPPYNQFQNFYPAGVNPYSLDPAQILASLQNTATNSNINEGANKTIFAVSDAQRQLTSELNGVEKNIYDSTGKIVSTIETHSLGLRDAIERGNVGQATAIEKTAANTQSTIERVNSQLATAIERNGANSMNTTERVGGQVSSAVERVGGQVGSSVERNGGNILSSIERVAGEGRLTTTVADAASRQAANDNARDIMSAVERNGAASVGTSKDAFNGLLASIERNAGENRVQTLTSSGILGTTLTDVRHSILNDVNRSAADLSLGQTQSLNVLTKHVTDAAWEGRTAMANGFQNIAEEHLRTKHDLAQQGSTYYASHMLEAQKLAHVTDSKADGHYASQMLEAQKLAHLLDNKADGHYASQMLEAQKLAHHSDSKADAHFAAILSKTDNQYASLMLEQQKVKECLAAQAANNFAINQLEQQKIKEVITIQLQDAKYEALKNKQDLSKEMAECCCEVKQKIDQRTQDVINTVDTLDRNRLRDEVNTINNENTILRLLDDDWGHGRGRRGRGRRSRSRSRSSDRGSRR